MLHGRAVPLELGEQRVERRDRVDVAADRRGRGRPASTRTGSRRPQRTARTVSATSAGTKSRASNTTLTLGSGYDGGARLVRNDSGWLEPEGDGWYVLNASDARWLSNEMGWYCSFEGAERFPEFGLNINFLPPGKPIAMYHHEPHQEGFFVIRGEAILIVEGEEQRPARAGTTSHFAAGVAARRRRRGRTGALVLAVGGRVGGGGATYPVGRGRGRARAGRRPSRRAIRARHMRASTRLEPSAYSGRAAARMSGWHIVNARDVQWFDGGRSGSTADFQQGEHVRRVRFQPRHGAARAAPMAIYHREPHQEGFLVLSGEALLIVEGEERPLRRWDYFHCPRRRRAHHRRRR